MNNKIGVRTKHSLRDFILEKQEENEAKKIKEAVLITEKLNKSMLDDENHEIINKHLSNSNIIYPASRKFSATEMKNKKNFNFLTGYDFSYEDKKCRENIFSEIECSNGIYVDTERYFGRKENLISKAKNFVLQTKLKKERSNSKGINNSHKNKSSKDVRLSSNGLIKDHKFSASGLIYSPIKLPISHKYTISDNLLHSSASNLKSPQNSIKKSNPSKLKPTPYQQKEEERKKLQKNLLKNQIKYKAINSKEFFSTSSFDHIARSSNSSHNYDSLRISFSRSHANSAFSSGFNTTTNNYFNNSNYSAIIVPQKKVSLFSVKSLQSVQKDYKHEYDKKIIYPVLNNNYSNSTSQFPYVLSTSHKKALNFNSPVVK